ncbi:MAG TPA: ABC transporter ATP-binding protein, partial [Bacteroidota bacterium]|nr:ABC transporter ATP-binding protein [Bacteroidota bacterium]
MAALILKGISKKFGAFTAVRPTDLEIPSGEFFAILGPSGCGKTTLLRLIAGYERPDEGRILLEDEDVTTLRPPERGIGMVFQNYALFPHMNVFDNVAFGLRARKLAPREIHERVMAALESVSLPERSRTPVPALSGGEQQRVAVARALVIRPRLLLFDEPLSNLDIALRLQTREEIRTLQRSTGITTVYVTHDQGEAMSLADRIAVMRAGGIEQSGSPGALYNNPVSPFVAEFMGGAALIDCQFDAARGAVGWDTVLLRIPGGVELPPPGPAVLAIRPEGVSFAPPGEGGDLGATVRSREYTGFTTTFGLLSGDRLLKALVVSTPDTGGI